MSENEARQTPSELYRKIIKENEEIMSEYENDILKDREKSYGDPIQMHTRIAQIWSAILNKPVTAYEVALCMTGLKLVRATKNASDPDSLIDAHGYTEIAQTIQADNQKTSSHLLSENSNWYRNQAEIILNEDQKEV